MTEHDDSTSRWSEYVPAAIVVVGAVQFTSYVGIHVWFDGLHGIWTALNLVGIGISFALAAPVVGAGVWLARSDVASARYERVPRWWASGVAFFLVLNLPLILLTPDLSVERTASWIHYAMATGSTGGVIVGASQARAVERARAAERTEVAASREEHHRKWLDYLNGLLRHEVLNNAHVISGHADLAIDRGSGELDDYLRTIRRQSEDMTRVIQDVRILIEAQQGDGSMEPVDLTAVLADELADVEAASPTVEVDASVPTDVYVRADDLVNRVFGNLFSNAVEHNDGETPTLEVRVGATPETVTVTVADDGPGVPASVREELFERTGSGDHGLGLYLVHELVERYDGDVELAKSDDDGTTFSVTLPRAEPPQEAANRGASQVPERASRGRASN